MKTSRRRKSTGRRTKVSNSKKSIDYKEDFLNLDLQDLDRAADYLSAAIEQGERVFLLAVRDVVEAQGGIAKVAKATKLNRENLYDMLSKGGNPRLTSITSILNSLGFAVKFSPKPQSANS